MRRKLIISIIAILGLVGLSLSAYGLEKSEFVTKCMANGRDYKPCACTYNALPDLPDAYADLAVIWAHSPPSDYTLTYIKVVAKDLIPLSGGRTTSYGQRGPQTNSSYFGKLVKSVGTSVALKWAVNLLPGVDGGASLLVTSATKATSKLGYAQYIFDHHCGKRLQTAVSKVNDIADAATSAAKDTLNAIGQTIGLSD